jgi:predicted site-specific integrase-resolvase
VFNKWLPLRRAAELAGVSRQWIWRLGREGSIRTLRTPAGCLYHADDVQAAGERHRTGRRGPSR